MNGFVSHQLQPQVEAPSILCERNTAVRALTRDEEDMLAFCEALVPLDRNTWGSFSVPPSSTSLVSSLLPPSSTLASAVPLEEDELYREYPGAPILDDPDPPYNRGTHPCVLCFTIADRTAVCLASL